MKLNEFKIAEAKLDKQVAAKPFPFKMYKAMLGHIWKMVEESAADKIYTMIGGTSLENRSELLGKAIEMLSDIRNALQTDVALKKMKESKEGLPSRRNDPAPKFNLSAYQRVVKNWQYNFSNATIATAPYNTPEYRITVIQIIIADLTHWRNRMEAEIAVMKAARK